MENEIYLPKTGLKIVLFSDVRINENNKNYFLLIRLRKRERERDKEKFPFDNLSFCVSCTQLNFSTKTLFEQWGQINLASFYSDKLV